MKNSDKLLILIARSKTITKTTAAKTLGISRPTLDKKIKDNDITEDELLKVQNS